MFFRISYLVILLCLICSEGYAQQNIFPFLAEVNSQGVNVRAGQSKNFERLCKLDIGEQVVVYDKTFSWYKIILPTKALSFIHEKFILIGDDHIGKIVGKRVNIRGGAGTKYTVLAQGNTKDEVVVINQVGEWVQIEPLDESFGWIEENLISFKTNNISNYFKKKSIHVDVKETTVLEEKLSEAVLKKISNQEFIAEGIIKSDGKKEINTPQYQIYIDGQPAYYLSGVNYILDNFINYKVSLRGKLNKDMRGELSYPVFVVSSLELIL